MPEIPDFMMKRVTKASKLLRAEDRETFVRSVSDRVGDNGSFQKTSIEFAKLDAEINFALGCYGVIRGPR